MPYITLHAHGEEIARHDLTGPTVVGRSPECHVAVRDVLLSRRHCRIEAFRGGWRIVDLDSRNGTHLNNRRLRHHTLCDGQTLRLGRTHLTFHAGAFVPAMHRTTSPAKPVRPADPFEALAGTVVGLLYIDPDDQAPIESNSTDESADEMVASAVMEEVAQAIAPADCVLPSGAERYGAERELLIQLAADVATWRRQSIGAAVLTRQQQRSARAERRFRPVHATLGSANRVRSITHPSEAGLSLQLLPHVDAPAPASQPQLALAETHSPLRLAIALTLMIVLATLLMMLCGHVAV